MKAEDEIHELVFQAEFPNTNDLRERAKQTINLQRAIGDIFAGLLANQIPLAMGVSISQGGSNALTGDRKINVTVYWRKVEDPRMHIFKDLQLAKRCLECADFMKEDHVCKPSGPLQNQNENVKGEALEEILQ